MQTTWIDRISDDSTLWSNAVKCEESGDFIKAVSLYLKDASECLVEGMTLKAALSTSSAADCLVKMGLVDYARLMYKEAGTLYAENGERVVNLSIREVLWSFREAYHFFLLAEDKARAEQTYKKYFNLAKRTDPFIEEESAVRSFQARESAPGIESGSFRGSSNPRIATEVERFLHSRKTGQYEITKPNLVRDDFVPSRRRGQLDEKSIINQLG
jgi:hypothetical protein